MPTYQEIQNEIDLKHKEMEESISKIKDLETKGANVAPEHLRYQRMRNEWQMLKDKAEGLKATGQGPVLSTIDAKKVMEADPVLRFVRAAQTKQDGKQGLEAHEIRQQEELAGASKDAFFKSDRDFIVPIAKSPQNFTTTTGTSLIPVTTQQILVQILEETQGPMRWCQVITTPSGEEIQYPVVNDTSAEAEIIGSENSNMADADLATPTHKSIRAHTLASKRIILSREAVADTSAINLISWAVQRATRRLAVGFAKYATTGTGTNEPTGVATSVGVTAANNAVIMKNGTGAQALTIDDLYNLYFAVKRPYTSGMENIQGGASALSGGAVGWMMSRAVLSQVARLTDGNNRPLMQIGDSSLGASGAVMPMTIFGLPVFENDYMDGNLTAGGRKSIIFGNGSYHLCRISDGIRIRAYDDDSNVGLTNSVHVFGHARFDAISLNATGTYPEAYKPLVSKA